MRTLAETAEEKLRAIDAQRNVEDADHHRNAPIPSGDCLYGLVGDVARVGGETTEANPFAIGLNMLAYLGCCVGRGPYLPVGNTYHHPRLFTMHVGRSGRGRKGDAVSLVHRIDKALRRVYPNLAPQVHRGGLSTREGLAHLIHDGFKEGRNEVEPVRDKRLWVLESEFANVLHQSKRDGNTLSSALRDCWDGVSIKPATKTNRVSATDPHVSLSAAVTPGELLSLMEARELTNGFANRFLVIFSERSRLLPFPTPTDQTVVDELTQRVAEVLDFAQAGRWVDRDRMRLEMDPQARRLYADLYTGELNRHDYGPLVTGLLERRAPVLQRIAMLLALTDRTQVIGETHILAALAWIHYWTDSVRFIFTNSAEEEAQRETTDTAKKILEFLSARGRQSRTSITAECFQGRLQKDRINAALDELLQSTPPAIQVEVEPRRDGPGSPTKFYRLTGKSAKSAKSANCGDVRGPENDPATREVCEVSDPGADHHGAQFAQFAQFDKGGPAASPRQHSRFAEFAQFADARGTT
jgi:hypothetical protein